MREANAAADSSGVDPAVPRFVAELAGQPAALQTLVACYHDGELQTRLDRFAKMVRGAATPVSLTGMGASYFAAIYAQYWFDSYGAVSRLDLTSYLNDHGIRSLRPDAVLVVFSQSGETVEARQLLQKLAGRCTTTVVTNDPASSVAAQAELVLPVLAARDGTVALQTYLNTLALVALAVSYALDPAPAEVANQLQEVAETFDQVIAAATAHAAPAVERLADCAQLYVLGRGPSTVTALEGALLIKETAKRAAEGFEAGAFRHGSVESVDRTTGCLLLDTRGSGSERNRRLSKELVDYGAQVVVYADDPRGWPASSRLDVLTVREGGERLAPLVHAPFLQLFAAELAKRNGIAPGSFRNTTPVISSD
jgi:glucosamine--fructose-6-phosphate aminotransferase (isomerizing)